MKDWPLLFFLLCNQGNASSGTAGVGAQLKEDADDGARNASIEFGFAGVAAASRAAAAAIQEESGKQKAAPKTDGLNPPSVPGL